MNPDLVKQAEGLSGCGKILVSEEKPKKCPGCGNKSLIRDPDTLDTWFSSGQWPHTTLGFEQEKSGRHKKDFEYFYPTSVMETGYEILFFWVARMIMLGLYRTGQVPFKVVYLHGLVRDAFGEKMSKSKGNVIDPLAVIEKYGADALRMALLIGTAPGNDSSLSEDKIRGFRNFANKVFNIGRFILTNLEEKPSRGKMEPKTAADKTILKESALVVKKVKRGFEGYRLSEAGQATYEFLWHSFADKYLEASKKQLKEASLRANTRSILVYVFSTQLKLLHPFMPFVTETLWGKLGYKKPLIISSWPR